MKHLALGALVSCALAGLAPAQQPLLPFPLRPVGPDVLPGGIVAEPEFGLVRALAGMDGAVRLEGLLLPDGEFVALALEPIGIAERRFGFQVNGRPRPDLLEGLDLSVWKGSVDGEAQSSVMLGFSNVGIRGWIQRGNEYVHLMPRPDDAGDWHNGDVLLISEAALNAIGMQPDFSCRTPAPVFEALPFATPDRSGEVYELGTCELLECTIAMETDWQLFQVFNDLAAQTAYVTTLLAWISSRYEEQVQTVLTFPYLQFYTDPNDPWTTPDTGGGAGAMLTEFRNAWVGNVPMGATLAHFMSGAGLGGGVAWLDVLCNDSYNFAVSGNINGGTPFPVQQGPNTWDFMVIAHEIGHNFGTPHTHDYCPPIDQCAPAGYYGQCQNQQVCTNQGTIMSYCHLCNGGMSNITTWFHPLCVNTMRTRAEACLSEYSGISGDVVDLFDASAVTPLTARVAGTPVGPVELHYRFGPGSYTTVAMTDQGTGLWAAEVPPAPCGLLVDYYYSFVEARCGAATDPGGAPATVYSSAVGSYESLFADDFETDQGWFATNLGATSGDFERGVPVNDPTWAYDPASDYDGSGQCYLTENALGNTDVDNGAVRLTSPSMDLAGHKVSFAYAYYLRLTNSNGVDRLLMEISTNGLAGPWTEIARHDSDGGTSWRTHRIEVADLDALGILPSADTRVRFTANDDNPQSIVEAALDAFVVSYLSCISPELGESYCLSTPNSTGSPASLTAEGSASLTANDLTLVSAPVPNQNGLFFYGPNQVQIPFGDGFQCVGGGIIRLNPPGLTTDNSASRSVDFLQQGFLPGQSVNFQHWYRDPAMGLSGFNLSDGLALTILP